MVGSLGKLRGMMVEVQGGVVAVGNEAARRIDRAWKLPPFESVCPKQGWIAAVEDARIFAPVAALPHRLPAAEQIEDVAVPVGIDHIEKWHLQSGIRVDEFV